jgi:hypothetical protein
LGRVVVMAGAALVTVIALAWLAYAIWQRFGF